MTTAWALPRELSIYTACEVRAQWLTYLAEEAADMAAEEHCRVQADAVEEVDAAGVQLLLSLSRALFQRERTLRLERPSRALAQACEALGAGALLATATATTDEASA